MCELLLRNVDNFNPTIPAEKQQSGLYKRGDIVAILPDGHVYGSAEGLPDFVVIKFPGVTIEYMQRYLEPEIGRGESIRVVVDDADVPNVVDFSSVDPGDVFDWEVVSSRNGQSTVDVFLKERKTRREFHMLLNSLPARELLEITTLGRTDTTFTRVRGVIQNKRTGQNESTRPAP
jgi:hypothetical protein